MSVYSFAYHAAKLYARIFYRVSFIGTENEPTEGSYIAFSNHTSYTDPVFTACGLKRRVSFMAKASLKKNPFLRWVFKSCGVFTVNRGESDMQAMRVAVDVIRQGKNLAIYPQGTRQPGVDPSPSLAQPGIGLIAKKTEPLLLPITICYGNTKKQKPTIFHKVKVYIGKPIPPSEYLSISESPNSREISEYCFSKISETFEKHNGK